MEMDIRQTWVNISLWQVLDILYLWSLDPIFKVIVLYVEYLSNQWMEFLQNYINVLLAQA